MNRDRIRTVFVLFQTSLLCIGALFGFTAPTHALVSVLPIDLSGEAPPFLTRAQMQTDLQVTKWLLRNTYARHRILKQAGTDWEEIFSSLEQELQANPNPLLTHHFQQKLLQELSFTEDPQLRGDLFLQKRHYYSQVEPRAAFSTGLRIVRQQGRNRVLPDIAYPIIANHWLAGCSSGKQKLFPVIPERADEPRFELGKLDTLQPQPLVCDFENELGTREKVVLPLTLAKAKRTIPGSRLFKFSDGHIPYLAWYREGKDRERATREFLKVGRQLRKAGKLVLDVRGNHDGTFSFIEKWLRELTGNQWKNVILLEKQTIPIMRGLMNRVQWDLRYSRNPLVVRDVLEKRRLQLLSLLEHYQENDIQEKWVETKFIFSGIADAPAWNKRMVVVVNEHCGDGCQFLAALAKQLNDSYLVGSMTGTFPRDRSIPLYQLPHSRILLSISHRLHLDEDSNPVAPSGYQPDYWLFHNSKLQDVLRFAGSL